MAIYLYLGTIAFDLMTAPSSESHEVSHVFSRIKPAYGAPLLQDRGADLDTIRLSFRLHRKYGDPQEKVGQLRDAAERGIVLPLVFANGDYPGDYVIERLVVTDVQTDGMRRWLMASGDIDLVRAPAASVLIRSEPKDRGDTVTIAETAPSGNGADVVLDNVRRM